MFHVMEREDTVFLKCARESVTSSHVIEPDPIHV
jgi:hypothetical protein